MHPNLPMTQMQFFWAGIVLMIVMLVVNTLNGLMLTNRVKKLNGQLTQLNVGLTAQLVQATKQMLTQAGIIKTLEEENATHKDTSKE